jgi:HAD superfamily hydrolase (TIGR01509 family)
MIKAIIFDCYGVLVDDYGKRNDELLALARELHSNYKTAVLSNVGKGGLSRFFTAEELEQDFDAAITSGDIGVQKPNPEIFLHVCERLGATPADCIFIDDSAGHCEGARAVGMRAVVYESLGQAKAELQELLNDSER